MPGKKGKFLQASINSALVITVSQDELEKQVNELRSKKRPEILINRANENKG